LIDVRVAGGIAGCRSDPHGAEVLHLDDRKGGLNCPNHRGACVTRAGDRLLRASEVMQRLGVRRSTTTVYERWDMPTVRFGGSKHRPRTIRVREQSLTMDRGERVFRGAAQRGEGRQLSLPTILC